MRYSFGLGESSLDHRRREEFPAIFAIMVRGRGVNELNKSEKQFFYKPQELQKNYIKSVEKKKFVK